MKEIGKIGFYPRGAYSDKVLYNNLDVVTKNGGSYVALVQNIGVPVTNTYYWMELARRGVLEWDELTDDEKEEMSLKMENLCQGYGSRIAALENKVLVTESQWDEINSDSAKLQGFINAHPGATVDVMEDAGDDQPVTVWVFGGNFPIVFSN